MYYINENIKNLYRIFDQNSRDGYLRLDLNENPVGLPQEFIDEVLSKVTPEFVAKYPEQLEFTKKLAKFIGVEVENICLVNGSAEGIRYIIQAYSRPGGKVLSVSPSYAMYDVYCEMYGRESVHVYYDENLEMHVEDIIDAINDDIDLVIILNPNNPVGDVYTYEEMDNILEACKKHECTLLIDEAYFYYYPNSFIKYAIENDHVLLTRTFSKVFSLAGGRLGYVVGKKYDVEIVQKLATPHNVNAFGMAFAQADLQPIATVKLGKSETITLKQLKSRVGLFERQANKKLSAEERKSVLEAYIDEKLILQAAAKAGLAIPDSQSDQYFLQTMMQQIGVPFSSEKELEEIILQTQGVSLDQFLKAQLGISKSEYKSLMKNQLISQNYIVSQRQAELQKIGPTDEQIRAFYEANKASLVWTDMMKIFALAVPKGSNPEQAKLTANDLRNKIVDKKLTVEQALVQAQKPDAGYQATEGLIQKNEAYAMQIGVPLQTLLTMFNQKEGFVSDIQETPADYRILVLRKKYDAKMLSISDVVQPETTMTVYEYIRQNLVNQMQTMYLQNAATEIAKSLNTPENVEYKKTGDALIKLLSWGE